MPAKKNVKNNKLKTALQFTKNIFTTGAIAQTSREVEVEITKYLDDSKDLIVVEFGLGHGNITKEILSKISKSSKLYSFEVNKEFCDYVAEEIKDERLSIINDGAENVMTHVKEEVDFFVSSIPITFFSKEKTELILQQSYKALKDQAHFSQILYSKIHIKKFENVFDEVEVLKTNNFPRGFVHHCLKNQS